MRRIDPSSRPYHADQFLELTWEMFGEMSRALAFRVARDYQPELVVGIARAGVIPGAVIASILGSEFCSIRISRHVDGGVRRRPAILSSAPADAEGRRVLLVDEITTSGETLRLALAALRDVRAKEIRTATGFVRPGGYKSDYFALETDQTVVLPWDRKLVGKEGVVVNPRYLGAVE